MNDLSKAVTELRDRLISVMNGVSVREAAKAATILFAEDEERCVELYLRGIPDLAPTIFWAFEPEMAREALDAIGDRLRLIVFDGKYAGGTFLPLIPYAKEKFSGPMIAASSNEDMRNEQMALGCTVEAKDKRDVSELIRALTS